MVKHQPDELTSMIISNTIVLLISFLIGIVFIALSYLESDFVIAFIGGYSIMWTMIGINTMDDWYYKELK